MANWQCDPGCTFPWHPLSARCLVDGDKDRSADGFCKCFSKKMVMCSICARARSQAQVCKQPFCLNLSPDPKWRCALSCVHHRQTRGGNCCRLLGSATFLLISGDMHARMTCHALLQAA